MQTFTPTPKDIRRKWFVVDATGKPLGRLASEVAKLLLGKHKPIFTPHMDTGDHVVVINADKVVLTGKKLDKKVHYWHTLYPGGLRSIGYRELMAARPEQAIEFAVWGMLPHNRLGRSMIKKLKVYRGPSHPHAAQEPELYEIKG